LVLGAGQLIVHILGWFVVAFKDWVEDHFYYLARGFVEHGRVHLVCFV